MVGSALVRGRLTLSGLAQGLIGDGAVRHRVKRVDRLLSNVLLHRERLLFYRLLCDLLIGHRREPVLIVDWSDLKRNQSWFVLRASVWVHGFCLPVYEEVHPQSALGSRQVQREFLLTLKMLLPEGACPIVITDAGFRGPWFLEVQRQGWHWLGRIRNRTMIEIEPEQWQDCKTFHAQACAVPQDLGEHRIARVAPFTGRLCLYKQPPQGPAASILFWTSDPQCA